ncbi:uncharacterized protein LOC111698541 [Eurytemora carolleeae]|uniref:uncharacterized protein LOC111698541 n=1 Tax=Eurytemora carolleeae TaxID=1294199 RepID=UPI000C774B0B|nr:uncharacterized protein LOC111698541 [Eurytemora carolleeae]|eukprot:XP_023324663.1 uncharacterized protein LOC111698541 [Eurytemora affinis]
MVFLIILIGISIGFSDAKFQIVDHKYNSGVRIEGETLEMRCRSNNHWEYCTWRHITGSGGVKQCDFEWKRMTGKVQVMDCHSEVSHRVSVSGDYEKHECGLKIENITMEDSGTWECEMEEYILLGGKGSGAKDEHIFNIEVHQKTTEPVVQSSTSASADSTTTAEFVTTADSVTTAVDGSSIEYNYDEPDLSVEEHLRHEDFENKIVDESDLEYTADSENDSDAPIYEPNDYDDLNTTKHHGNSSRLSGEEVTGEEEEGEVGLILGTCAALALVTAGVITVLVFLKRRMDFHDIVKMQKLRENEQAGFITDDTNDVTIIDISRIDK